MTLDAAQSPPSDLGCGRCGYPIHGLASPICPECGADRNVVGVRRPRGQRSRLARRALAGLAWTIGFALVIAIFWQRLLPLMPRQLSNHRDYVLTPRSDARLAIDVRRIGYGWGWPGWQGPTIMPGQGWLKLEPRQNEFGLVSDQPIGEFDFRIPFGDAGYGVTRFENGQPVFSPAWSGRFDEAAISRFLGLLDAPLEPAAATELLALMRAPTFDPRQVDAMQHFTAKTSGGVQASPAYRSAGPLRFAAAVVWAIGLAILMRVIGRRNVARV